ncbi:MAG TPA: hypothetical protein VFQ92_00220 [Blastocatellia bacterium]|nr:hypothetical protein [Blastocatellia bacterium]
MRRIGLQGLAYFLALAALSTHAGGAGQMSISPEEALKRAAAAEEELKASERAYTYRQEILVQAIGEAGSISGQYYRVSEIVYDDLGNRKEKIIEFPPSRLTNLLGVMKPDFKSLLGVEPFFLTPGSLSEYAIRFVERQRLDEINTFAYDVEPAPKAAATKRKQGDARPFKGRIWIEDQEFQMVKAEGRAFTNKDDREMFPKFEYYREYLWLPSYVYADDILEFKRYDVPLRMKIKYTGYKRVASGR